MRPTRARFFSGLLLLGALGSLLLFTFTSGSTRAAPFARTSNPYTGQFGPPNCTWYAWQRLHDTEHLDLQFAANANDWIDRAQQPNAVWSEDTNSYAPVQITTSPARGDVVVLPYAARFWAEPFHVAFVESNLDSRGDFQVSEQNYGNEDPGPNTQPYPYVVHTVWSLQAMQKAEQGHARFLHFPTSTFHTTPPSPGKVDNSYLFSSSPALVVEPGQQFSVNFTFENTGNSTWSDTDGYALGCDTYYHQDSNCMGGNPAGFGGQSVPPGQLFTFTVNLTAPSSPGVYQTWWDMAHQGSIFGNNNVSVQITVQGQSSGITPTPPPVPPTPTPTPTPTPINPVDGSQWVSNSPYLTVTPGQQFSIQFTFQNAGTTTWSDGGGYALGCDTYYHPESNCMGSGPVGFGGQSAAPGQQFTFTLYLTAPSSLGVYKTWWDMEHNGGIFGSNNAYVQVTVQAPVDGSQWVSNSPYLTVTPGQQFSLNFTFLNAGTTTWSDAGGYALACDTYYHPNTNCMGSGPAGFSGQSVAPGQQFTFTVNLTAPSSPGVYQTWWDMEHNGGIFGSNNVYVQVTVQAPSSTWRPWYAVNRPACDDSSAWRDVNQAATRDCSSLNPNPSAIGLMEESSKATSSAILYNQFEIDLWS